jgi:DNA-binding GntR family transcriptional regulator
MLTAESALRKDRTTSGQLQHRHFAEIARIIAAMPAKDRNNAAIHFAEHLKWTNPRFDRGRFLRACEA